MSNLTKDRIKKIEQEHNVYVDPKTLQYNRDSYKAMYGWRPIPQKWIEEV